MPGLEGYDDVQVGGTTHGAYSEGGASKEYRNQLRQSTPGGGPKKKKKNPKGIYSKLRKDVLEILNKFGVN